MDNPILTALLQLSPIDQRAFEIAEDDISLKVIFDTLKH
jgi:hypothetical protein